MSSPEHAAVRDEISLMLQNDLRQANAGGDGAGPEMEETSVSDGTGNGHKEYERQKSSAYAQKDASNTAVLIMGSMACVLIAIAIGFIAGYYTHSAMSRSAVAMTAETRETMRMEAVMAVSQEQIAEYESLHTSEQCIMGRSSCAGNLTTTIVDQLTSMGFKVSTSTYSALVSYPDMSQPTMLKTMDPEGNTLQTVTFYGGATTGPQYKISSMRLSAGPQENILAGTNVDSMIVSSEGSTSSMPVYTPYSASGTVTGDLIYINHGNEEDYATMADLGVDVSGKIGLARQGGMSAMEQITLAASHGIMGLLLYPDPNDMTSEMPMTSVMTPDLSGMMGDPLTPGCPSVDGIYRSSMDSANLPSIPVQPVSMETASMLLSNMTGVPADEAWIGGLNVSYHVGLTGDTRQSWYVELDVHNDIIQKPITDVVATLEGTEQPDQYVLLGGHYTSTMTAMVASGSSSAVMEAARVMSEMMSDGWMPRRTVMIGLWEGSEFGHSGSTEWAEENRMVLADRSVAYINLGGGTDGSMIAAQSSPLLQGMVMDAAEQIGLASMVNLGVLDGSGDHIAFSHMIGVPSAQIQIAESNFIDSPTVPTPDGARIQSMVSTQLGLHMVLSLADDEVLGLNAGVMADTVMTYVENLDAVLGDMMPSDNMGMTMLRSAASDFMSAVQDLQGVIGSDSISSPVTMAMVNSRLMYLERSFMDTGSDGMGTVLYGMHTTETFSTVSNMMRNGTDGVTMEMMQETISRLQCTIQGATQSLGMTLS
ncbi:aminopeptidase NAALADL1-like [Diadema antillarum]|uniref:aminopeptidase NAALADL1-like n=1 Tax=Diadema antillarum TaxID=105358 RepID=UPI003A88E40B